MMHDVNNFDFPSCTNIIATTQSLWKIANYDQIGWGYQFSMNSQYDFDYYEISHDFAFSICI